MPPRNPHHEILFERYEGNPLLTAEREGDVSNVVFPCGYSIGDDGDAINLY